MAAEPDPQEQVQAEVREEAAAADPDPTTRREALENVCRDEGEPAGGFDIGQPVD